MTILFIILAIILGFIAFRMYSNADKIEGKSNKTDVKSNLNEECEGNLFNPNSQVQYNNNINQIDKDNIDGEIIRYTSWTEYKTRHPERAKAIIDLGLDISQKNDIDASEMIFAIETAAHDSHCKISELKMNFYASVEKHNYSDGEWLYLIDYLVKVSKSEAKKYNLKIGNTFGDVMISFVLDKIKEIERNYINEPKLTSTDPLTLKMRFMLDSHSEILLLQKMHIYTKNFPLTASNKQFRENWHNQIMSIITDRLSIFEDLKNQPSIYNMTIATEIYKFTYEEAIKDVPKDVLKEFNDHLLSFHEEMELISNEALSIFTLSV